MVYLDNAANAPVFPEVLEAMLPWLRPDHVGNPGSLHTQGVNAREAVENARRQVAKMIGADPSEVFFTSGGTESNNAWLQNFGGDLILTTALEHDSVLEPMSAHCHRHYIKVHKDGSVDLNDLERFLTDAHTAESNYLPRDGRSTAALCPVISSVLLWVLVCFISAILSVNPRGLSVEARKTECVVVPRTFREL